MSVTGGSEWLWLPHVHWAQFIALYLFLGGTAGGAYVTSSWASLMKSLMDADSWLGKILLARTDDDEHRYACAETARWGSVLSVLSIAVGGVALLSHLGAPLRALTFPVLFTNFGSWLVIGTWVIVLFTVVAALETLWLHFGANLQSQSGLSMFPRRILGWIDGVAPWSADRGIVWLLDTIADTTRPPSRVHGAFRLLGGALALLLIAYTAMLLSDVAVVPLWERTYLPFIFLLSGVSTGISAALLGTVASGGALTRTNHRFCLTDDAIIVVELVAIGLLVSYLASSPDVAANVTETALFGTYGLEFVGGVLILGTGLPVVLSITVTMLHQFTDVGETLWGERLLTGGYALKYTLVLVGGFLLRYVILMAAVKTPLAVPGL
ncbi:Formate-dependent nitrite reductase, membrane component [Halapricum desulfuricans]|uniref:Formate-dependent nitrite reductase, membrane component n=1 Tax=Halapricum desulfuricans TaxID=2841257 RepID=A0A897NR45_9EURY|nr:NrfD/PsrC family molybdoenzyme membrane anchor subunit [Halapricum desulfuricans]QSG13309.1 Formate-dependent nitrite reductase, membrane component [Halapricum desulfuricans]